MRSGSRASSSHEERRGGEEGGRKGRDNIQTNEHFSMALNGGKVARRGVKCYPSLIISVRSARERASERAQNPQRLARQSLPPFASLLQCHVFSSLSLPRRGYIVCVSRPPRCDPFFARALSLFLLYGYATFFVCARARVCVRVCVCVCVRPHRFWIFRNVLFGGSSFICEQVLRILIKRHGSVY